MPKRFTLSNLKKALRHSDAQIAQGDDAPTKPKRRRPTERTEAQLALLRAERERLRNQFLDHWRRLGGPDVWVAEYIFHPTRQWPIDLAIPELKIMVELDGGTWSKEKTGHNWGVGIRRDHEKQNAAVLLGWRPFRFTSDMLAENDAPQQIAPLLALVQGER